MQNPKYVRIPIDVLNVKKVVFIGLTKRQLTAGGIGAAVGILPFFAAMAVAGVTAGGFTFFICGLPVAFVCAYEKNGITFNTYIRMVISFRKKARKRLYKSRNVIEYAQLQNEKRRLERSLKNGYIYEES